MSVVRHPGHVDTGSPSHCIDDVVVVAPALAECAYGHDGRDPVDPGDPGAVVAGGSDDAGDVCAVPRALRHPASGERSAGGGVVARDPVARVVGIRIPAVAVIGGVHVRDEVITGQETAGEVGMVGEAGVDHGDHDAGGPCRDVPCGRGIGPVVRRADGTQVPLVRVVRVIGHEGRVHPSNRFDRQDAGFGAHSVHGSSECLAVEAFGQREHVGRVAAEDPSGVHVETYRPGGTDRT
ncbi:unannotated protein [freshwater metagenome]|uniref:Unannotated protein n=1 Tax=freshwater metagenome TaxID=449393 RepID=A0A6J7EHA3_9ZZZZ